jgi:two-component system alkaline phosphatase synthesis response regulator PhoP
LILVVDDDPKIVNLVRTYLVNGGFDVVTAGEGRTALRLIRERRPALVVLDLMLPGMDGIAITRKVREETSTPILMLTARGAAADRIGGLTEGADDYVSKPFAPAELVLRVKAILRRSQEAGVGGSPITHADLVIDPERQLVTRAGEPVPLSLVEFRILHALVAAGGRVLTRDRLLDAISGPHSDGVLERSVDVYVGRLRAKLGDPADEPRYLVTVRGVGYRAAI